MKPSKRNIKVAGKYLRPEPESSKDKGKPVLPSLDSLAYVYESEVRITERAGEVLNVELIANIEAQNSTSFYSLMHRTRTIRYSPDFTWRGFDWRLTSVDQHAVRPPLLATPDAETAPSSNPTTGYGIQVHAVAEFGKLIVSGSDNIDLRYTSRT